MPPAIPKKVTELTPEEQAARYAGVFTPKHPEEMSLQERVAQIPGIEPLPGQDPTLRAPRYVEEQGPYHGLLPANDLGFNIHNTINGIPDIGWLLKAPIEAMQGLRSIPAALRAAEVAKEAGIATAGSVPAAAALIKVHDEPTIRRKP